MNDLRITFDHKCRGEVVELAGNHSEVIELYVAEGRNHHDAIVTLDRSQATQIRDWINEWLTDSEAVAETPEPVFKPTPKRSSEYWII